MIRRVAALSLCLGLLAACAATPKLVATPKTEKIKVVEDVQGRLLVMTAARRIQLWMQWHATMDAGTVRLTHAASGRVLDVRWQANQQSQWIEMRDNQEQTQWTRISMQAWRTMGVVLAPWTLAALLHHQPPKFLQAQDAEHWQGRVQQRLIRIHWQRDAGILTMRDMSAGNTAILRMER